jgi:hypothetical protein
MKGLLFTPEMALAVMAGRKTQTRRVVPGTIKPCRVLDDTASYLVTPTKATPPRPLPGDFCQVSVGDVVCLLTTWAVAKKYDRVKPSKLPKKAWATLWHAGMTKRKPLCNVPPLGRSRPGRFLPNSMRHLMQWLKIEDVDVQRVRQITDADAIAEGVKSVNGSLNMWAYYHPEGIDPAMVCGTPRRSFRSLWNSINAARGKSWASNPQVFVIKFVKVGTVNGGTFTLSVGGRTSAPLAYNASQRAVSKVLRTMMQPDSKASASELAFRKKIRSQVKALTG